MGLLWEAFKALIVWVLLIPMRIAMALGSIPDLIQWFRAPANRREAWGYLWWGAAAIVVAVPELWAAFGGKDVLWPTISGTTGRLEVRHVWVAMIVVAVLVWAAAHAVRVTREQLRVAAVEAGASEDVIPPPAKGAAFLEDVERFTQVNPSDTRDIGALEYLVFAVVLVAIPSALIKSLYHGDDHRYVFGETLYASIGFWWLIVPGWIAYKRGYLVPYPPLFRTLKDLAGRVPRFTVVLMSALLILLVHLILYPWPSTIPDTNRLHLQYQCHPLKDEGASPKPPSKVDPEKVRACKQLQDADLAPPLGTP